MIRVKNKLNSNRGASMILALALFMICVTVSSIVVAVAASGTSRNAQRVEQQQSYLAISSAADVLVEDLSMTNKFVGTKVIKEYGCINDCVREAEIGYSIGGTYVSVSGRRLDSSFIWNSLDEAHLLIPIEHNDTQEVKGIDDTQSTFEGKLLSGMMKRASEHVYTEGEAYKETIVISIPTQQEFLPDVICEMVMDTDYNVTIQLTTDSTEYSVIISMNASNPDVDSTTTVDSTSDIHTIYYKKYDSTSGTFEDVTCDMAIDVTTTQSITTVKWGVPSVKKGVLLDEEGY